jgi:predicted peptidase
MTHKEEKKKTSSFDTIINIFCFLILIALIANEYSHLNKPANPILDRTYLYDKHIHFTPEPPFVIRYYLLKPIDYTPDKYKYPLILFLHGVGGTGYAPYQLADQTIRKNFPAFVLMPIISKRSVWAAPEDSRYDMARGGLKFPDATSQAISIIDSLTKTYRIDTNRLYLTGTSMGGNGVIGSLLRFPDIFAGAIAVSGTWNPSEVNTNFNTALWIFHGTKDRQIPIQPTRKVYKELKNIGVNVGFTEIPGKGHHISPDIFGNMNTWHWLFSQRLIPLEER